MTALKLLTSESLNSTTRNDKVVYTILNCEMRQYCLWERHAGTQISFSMLFCSLHAAGDHPSWTRWATGGMRGQWPRDLGHAPRSPSLPRQLRHEELPPSPHRIKTSVTYGKHKILAIRKSLCFDYQKIYFKKIVCSSLHTFATTLKWKFKFSAFYVSYVLCGQAERTIRHVT